MNLLNYPDDPARVGSPDYLEPVEPQPIEPWDIDAALDEASHATLLDWLTEGCFFPGWPARHDPAVMVPLRTAAISERDEDAMTLGRAIVRIIREAARESLS